jgi:Sigma-70, region 4
MPEDPEQRAITEALNRIDSFGALGRNPLARSRVVDAGLARAGLSDTSFQRGRVLSRLIRQEVRQQFEEREARPEGRDVAEWTILYLRVHDGLSLQEIGSRLRMPERSVARYYSRAKEQLLDRLYTLSEQTADPGIYCPSCGTRLENLQPQHTAFRICRVCAARMEFSPIGSDTLQIILKPVRDL